MVFSELHHRDGPGRLERVRSELGGAPSAAVVCRAANPYPLGDGVAALPLSALPSWLAG